MPQLNFTGEEYHGKGLHVAAPGVVEVDDATASYLLRTHKKWFSPVGNEAPHAGIDEADQPGTGLSDQTPDAVETESPEKPATKAKPTKKGKK